LDFLKAEPLWHFHYSLFTVSRLDFRFRLFAFASLAEIETKKIVVSPLYGADIFGGCAGSLFGSLILIPFFGRAILDIGRGSRVGGLILG
jgi:hypothetical protein